MVVSGTDTLGGSFTDDTVTITRRVCDSAPPSPLFPLSFTVKVITSWPCQSLGPRYCNRARAPFIAEQVTKSWHWPFTIDALNCNADCPPTRSTEPPNCSIKSSMLESDTVPCCAAIYADMNARSRAGLSLGISTSVTLTPDTCSNSSSATVRFASAQCFMPLGDSSLPTIRSTGGSFTARTWTSNCFVAVEPSPSVTVIVTRSTPCQSEFERYNV